MLLYAGFRPFARPPGSTVSQPPRPVSGTIQTSGFRPFSPQPGQAVSSQPIQNQQRPTDNAPRPFMRPGVPMSNTNSATPRPSSNESIPPSRSNQNLSAIPASGQRPVFGPFVSGSSQQTQMQNLRPTQPGSIISGPERPPTLPQQQFNRPSGSAPAQQPQMNPLQSLPQFRPSFNPQQPRTAPLPIQPSVAAQNFNAVPAQRPFQPSFTPQQVGPTIPLPQQQIPVVQSPSTSFQPQSQPMSGTPLVPGFSPGVPGLAGGFQNMNLNAGQPTGVNLMAGPPPIEEFDHKIELPQITSQSVAQSPFANTSATYKVCCLQSFPSTQQLLDQSKLLCGVLLSPFHQLEPGEAEVPIIQTPQIVRCRRCRTYVNPWISFIEQGSRWKCNMCSLSNDVPQFFDWDQENQQRVDRLKRPELTHGVVEYVAPQEYMVRAPQPVVIVFVIDVSSIAIRSGMVAVAAHTILNNLDQIANSDDRTKIGFIAFDSALHFFNLGPENIDPTILVVSDIAEPYLPVPEDLLVSLTESKATIYSFLKKLPSIFQSNYQTGSALGGALRAAEKLIGPIGGKIIALQYEIPNLEPGLIKPREDPKSYGTPKESMLLEAQSAYYKNLAIDCSPSQISFDLFLFNGQYADVATLSNASKFTAGAVHYCPGFNAENPEDANKLSGELGHILARPLGLEAVLRIRASKGIKMTTFHGNFFLRSTDLLSLPNVNPDNLFTIELSVTEEIKSPVVCFQTALLYTSNTGERRIRVLTMSIPVTNSVSELYSNANCKAMATLLMKKGCDY